MLLLIFYYIIFHIECLFLRRVDPRLRPGRPGEPPPPLAFVYFNVEIQTHYILRALLFLFTSTMQSTTYLFLGPLISDAAPHPQDRREGRRSPNARHLRMSVDRKTPRAPSQQATFQHPLQASRKPLDSAPNLPTKIILGKIA